MYGYKMFHYQEIANEAVGGQCFQSCLSISHSSDSVNGGGVHVTITHEALDLRTCDLTVQGPFTSL